MLPEDKPAFAAISGMVTPPRPWSSIRAMVAASKRSMVCRLRACWGAREPESIANENLVGVAWGRRPAPSPWSGFTISGLYVNEKLHLHMEITYARRCLGYRYLRRCTGSGHTADGADRAGGLPFQPRHAGEACRLWDQHHDHVEPGSRRGGDCGVGVAVRKPGG